MKSKIMTVVLLNLMAVSLSFAGSTKRGVHVSSDTEVREANKHENTAGQSDYDNNPVKINQQRMEENPQGVESNPANWPQGPASKARTGEKIED